MLERKQSTCPYINGGVPRFAMQPQRWPRGGADGHEPMTSVPISCSADAYACVVRAVFTFSFERSKPS